MKWGWIRMIRVRTGQEPILGLPSKRRKARRAWAGNDGAVYAASKAMEAKQGMNVTLPAAADEKLVAVAVKQAFK